jgi:hypothetical protein
MTVLSPRLGLGHDSGWSQLGAGQSGYMGNGGSTMYDANRAEQVSFGEIADATVEEMFGRRGAFRRTAARAAGRAMARRRARPMRRMSAMKRMRPRRAARRGAARRGAGRRGAGGSRGHGDIEGLGTSRPMREALGSPMWQAGMTEGQQWGQPAEEPYYEDPYAQEEQGLSSELEDEIDALLSGQGFGFDEDDEYGFDEDDEYGFDEDDEYGEEDYFESTIPGVEFRIENLLKRGADTPSLQKELSRLMSIREGLVNKQEEALKAKVSKYRVSYDGYGAHGYGRRGRSAPSAPVSKWQGLGFESDPVMNGNVAVFRTSTGYQAVWPDAAGAYPMKTSRGFVYPSDKYNPVPSVGMSMNIPLGFENVQSFIMPGSFLPVPAGFKFNSNEAYGNDTPSTQVVVQRPEEGSFGKSLKTGLGIGVGFMAVALGVAALGGLMSKS